jgi:hypothetical protein
VLSYIAAAASSYSLIISGFSHKIIKAHFSILAFVSIYGLYIYFAQKYNLWEPLRNRLGTGGQDFRFERVEFQYLFHRALGSFREPSHLANWLACTIIFLLPQKKVFKNRFFELLVIFLSIALLILTGSFLGIICLLAGLMTFAVVARRMAWVLSAFSLVMTLILIWLAESLMGVDLLSALLPRFEQFAQGGLYSTNRSEIYYYLSENIPQFQGIGIGHSALLYSQYTGDDLISPIINLFITVWYEAGVVGISCIIFSFFLPIIRMGEYASKGSTIIAGSFSAHICWIFAYFGMVPELSPYHATTIGIFFGQIYLMKHNNHYDT